MNHSLDTLCEWKHFFPKITTILFLLAFIIEPLISLPQHHVAKSAISRVSMKKGRLSARFSSRNVKKLTKQLIMLLVQSKNENFTQIKRLIDSGANINAYDRLSDGTMWDNAFQWVCYLKYWKSAEYMLDHGANPNPKQIEADQEYYSPVSSISTGTLRLLKKIISSVGNVNDHKSTFGKSPLMCASESSKLDNIKYLVSQSASVNVVDDRNLSAFTYAHDETCQKYLISKGAREAEEERSIDMLINNKRRFIRNYVRKQGNAHDAERVWNQKIQSTRALLNFIHMKYINRDWTNSFKKIKPWIDLGAEVGVTDGGMNALQYACQTDSDSSIEYMLRGNPKVNSKTGRGNYEYYQSPIATVAKMKLSLLKKIVSHGAPVNDYLNYHFTTPLINATRSNRLSNVKFLIASGARINDVDRTLHTALDFSRNATRSYLRRKGALTYKEIKSRDPQRIRKYDFIERVTN